MYKTHEHACRHAQKGNTNEKPIKVDNSMQFNMKVTGWK